MKVVRTFAIAGLLLAALTIGGVGVVLAAPGLSGAVVGGASYLLNA
ncbi:MAG: hypothetical protein OEL20_05090 [Sulfuritalea sp.]|nr:hypothetical protein [Sulfuritalea sp.]